MDAIGDYVKEITWAEIVLVCVLFLTLLAVLRAWSTVKESFKIVKTYHDEIKPPETYCIYEMMERTGGMPPNDEPPLTDAELSAKGKDGWRLKGFYGFPNGSIFYIWEKEVERGR